MYWESSIIPRERLEPLHGEAEELLKIVVTSIKTKRHNMKTSK